MRKLAQAYSLNLAAMQKHPPVTPHDWARKLLLGIYTVDHNALNADTLRRSLTAVMKDGRSPTLKRTQTKVHSGAPEAEEICQVAKVYNELDGNLQKLADKFNANFELIFKHQPQDANSFATALLSGEYSEETSEEVRRRLRAGLQGELKDIKGKLKRTETKVGAWEPDPESIAACAMMWEEHFGDMDKIASVTGCSAALLKAANPQDSMTFGRNFLLGFYCH